MNSCTTWERLAAATVLLAFLAAPLARAQPASAVRQFEEGNRHYAEGRYERALASYEGVLDDGYASGALYYNLGSAYFRTGQLGQAIRYYEKARRYLPTDDRLLHNLEIARSRTAGAAPLPRSYWSLTWQRLASVADAGTLFGLGLVFYGMGLLLLARRLWTGAAAGRWRRRATAGALAAGGLLVALAFAASAEHLFLARPAIVIAEEAPLHARPAAGATVDSTLYEGAALEVLRRRATWVEVQLPDGTAGWLPAHSLGEV